MLEPAAPAPDHVMDRAAALASVALADPMPELASFPIPIHRMRPGDGPGGWNAALPRTGWAIPVFADERLCLLATIGESGSDALRAAGDDTDLGAALRAAAGIAETANGPARLRMIESPGIPEAFWIEWQHDTFVLTSSVLVLSGPAFVGLARRDDGSPGE